MTKTHEATLSKKDKEHYFLLRMERTQLFASVAKHLIKYGAITAVAYFVYRCTDALAGKQTDANIVYRVVSNLLSSEKATEGLSAAVAVFCLYLANRWKRQYRDTIEELGKLRQAYEKLLDPKRSSSKLDARGATRKEDDR